MHGVSSKALAVDVHVGHHMPVKAVVMPDFLNLCVLEEGTELLKDGCRLLLCFKAFLFTELLQIVGLSAIFIITLLPPIYTGVCEMKGGSCLSRSILTLTL